MSAFHDIVIAGASGSRGYQISRSVRLRSSASAYFSRTPGSASNRTTWTWSGWLKRGAIGTGPYVLLGANNSPSSDALYFSNDALTFAYYTGTTTVVRQTTAVYRDPSSWYHIVVVADTTNATAQNRMRFYINGSEVTAWSTNLTITQNQQYVINAAVAHNLGCNIGPQQYTDGYLTEINFIDGQALTPSAFGETDAITGVWKPKKYAGTYGTNGFYLNFSDNSAATAAAIGKDYSGNGNNWTPNNISVTAGATYDSMLDVPTAWADGGNGRGNYAVLNPLAVTASTGVITAGNLNATTQGTGGGNVYGSIAIPTSGKWYWEVTGVTVSSPSLMVGVAAYSPSDSYAYYNASSLGYYSFSGNKFIGNVGSAYGATWTDGDNIGVAVDADAGTVTFYKNGTSQGAITYNAAGLFPFGCDANSSLAGSMVFNFGQRPFVYTPPTGFKALNTQNLPEPTIANGRKWFDATLATGNNSTQVITNAGGFQPDLVWMKIRSAAENHILYDAARGVQNYLVPNLTIAEGTSSQGLTSFNSTGFTLGNINPNYAGSPSFVAWQWKEGATPGFDIVTYTGTGVARTVAHSLGVAPAMIIVKARSAGTANWRVYHINTGGDRYLELNTTASSTNVGAAIWNSTLPTSSVFTVGTDSGVNANGVTYVAYLFAEVPGFSKISNYIGNGSADGPFVFCGFRPRYVLVKRGFAIADWYVWDTARNAANALSQELYPNASNAEGTDAAMDATANGFKLRNSKAGINGSGDTYIYAAFAEHPLKYALAR